MAWKKVIGVRGKKFQSYKQLIVENLNLNHNQASSVLSKNTHILDIPKERIIRNCEICQVSTGSFFFYLHAFLII